jgi:hypothetical protein
LLTHQLKIKNIYGQHPKTGPSAFQMVIFWTLLVSGFQMHLKTGPDVF